MVVTVDSSVTPMVETAQPDEKQRGTLLYSFSTRVTYWILSLPNMTVYITPPYHPGAVFQALDCSTTKLATYRMIRLRKAVAEMFPTPTFSAPALFQLFQLFQLLTLWRYRPWNVGPGVCDTHNTQSHAVV